MKKRIIVAATLGFLVPVFCGAMEMFFFSAKDSVWVDFFCFVLPVIVCPAWALGDGSGYWFVAIPFLNALTYAAVAFLWFTIKDFFKSVDETETNEQKT